MLYHSLKRKNLNLNTFSNSNSNYSSFIQHFFKVVYSGALPAQHRSNNVALRPEKNRAEWVTGIKRSATGRPFQAVGSATEKARRCRITVRVRGPVTPPGQKSAMRYEAE